MDLLKKIFPISFAQKKDLGTLIVSVIIQVVAGLIISVTLGVLGRFIGGLFVLSAMLGLLGSIVGLYITGSIVFTFLDYFKVIK